jgi:hypothetical protein
MFTNPALQKILKTILHSKEEEKHNNESMKNNVTRRVGKPMNIREESSIAQTIKSQELLHAFRFYN